MFFFKCIKTSNEIQTLYSVLCWSTFGSDYSLESSWVWHYKLGTPVFGEFLPFFSADPLKLRQVGWGALLYTYFQVSPEMFDLVQVQALAGPLKDIERLVQKPLLRGLGCVLRVVVLLEGEPLAQSEVPSALEQVFIKDLSVPATEKHPHSIMLPPPCFTVWMVLARWWAVPGFLQTWRLAFKAKGFNLGFVRPENLVTHGLRVI